MLLTDVCRKPEIGNHLISIYYGIPLPSVSCHPVVGAKDEQDAQDAPSVSVEAVESQADPYSFFPSIAPYKAAQLFLEEDKAKLGACVDSQNIRCLLMACQLAYLRFRPSEYVSPPPFKSRIDETLRF